MIVETIPNKPAAPPKVAEPELRLEDIGAKEKDDQGHATNALVQADALIAYAARKLIAHVGSLKHLAKCKATVTLKITLDHRPDANGRSQYSAMCQPEVKTPAPLPKLDHLHTIEVNGKPTLARGFPEEEGDELPFSE